MTRHDALGSSDEPSPRPPAQGRRPAAGGRARRPLAGVPGPRPDGRVARLRLDLGRRPPPLPPARRSRGARSVGVLDDARRARRVDRAGSSSGRSSPRPASTPRRCWPRRPRRSTRSAAAGSSWGSARAGTRPSTRPSASRSTTGSAGSRRRSRSSGRCSARARSTSRVATTPARDCELLPRGPRPGGPPILLGSSRRADAGDRRAAHRRLERVVRRHRQRPAGVAPLRDRVDAAARAAGPGSGRDRANGRRPRPAHRRHGAGSRATSRRAEIPRSEGPPETLAEELRAYAREGIGHVQLVLDPITEASLEEFAPVLDLLDQG